MKKTPNTLLYIALGVTVVVAVVYLGRQVRDVPPVADVAQVAAPAATPAKHPYIGMETAEFHTLCNTSLSEPGDRINSLETANGYSVSYYLERTDTRGNKLCYGTFTFGNWRLHSISR